MRALTSAAKRAISATASAGISSEPSRWQAGPCCLTSAFSVRLGCARSRASVSDSSSTRMGKRPCNSGMRSWAWPRECARSDEEHVVGLERPSWSKPSSLQRWAEVALHAPRVRRRAVTPPSRPATLSSSSMKMMPSCGPADRLLVTRSISDELADFFVGSASKSLENAHAPVLGALCFGEACSAG